MISCVHSLCKVIYLHERFCSEPSHHIFKALHGSINDLRPHKIAHLLPLPAFYSPSVNAVFLCAPFASSAKKIKQCKSALQSDPHPHIWLIPKRKWGKWNVRNALEKDSKTKSYFYEISLKGSVHFFDQRKLFTKEGAAYLTHLFTIYPDKPYFLDGTWHGLEGDFSYRMLYHPRFTKALQRKQREVSLTLLQFFQRKESYRQIFSRFYEWLLKKLGS